MSPVKEWGQAGKYNVFENEVSGIRLNRTIASIHKKADASSIPFGSRGVGAKRSRVSGIEMDAPTFSYFEGENEQEIPFHY